LCLAHPMTANGETASPSAELERRLVEAQARTRMRQTELLGGCGIPSPGPGRSSRTSAGRSSSRPLVPASSPSSSLAATPRRGVVVGPSLAPASVQVEALTDERVALNCKLAEAHSQLNEQREDQKRLLARLGSASRQLKIEQSRKQSLEKKVGDMMLAIEAGAGDPAETLSKLAEILDSSETVAGMLLRAAELARQETSSAVALKGEKERLAKKLERVEGENERLSDQLWEMKLSVAESLSASRKEIEVYLRRSEASEVLNEELSARLSRLVKEHRQQREYIKLLEASVARLGGQLRGQDRGLRVRDGALHRREVDEQLVAFRRSVEAKSAAAER
ncbi:hypothetical protein FOZ63_005847, partial [Perkinsus olseni]